MTPHIYALVVGINDYPSKPLQGCLQDQQAMINFLKWYHPEPDKLHIRTLTDSEATRDAVIQGFEHFGDAGPADICIFSYSGHGSFSEAPKGFYTPTNRFHQSLVCWDSRQPGGRDLMDKELAFLIWKYTTGLQKSGLRFVVITDSCHSGSVTRNFFDNVETNFRERTLNPQNSVEASDYYGYDEEVNGQRGYTITREDGRELIRVETGPHIHLAAARANQTAKEDRFNGEVRGLFTYSLLKALQESRGLISYSELIRRTEIQIKSFISDQNPDLALEEVPERIGQQRFLFEENLSSPRTNWLYYNSLRGWCIDVGTLLGASVGDEVWFSDNQKTKIVEAFPEESVVFEKPSMAPVDRYIATFVPQNKVQFDFDADINPKVKSLLESVDIKGLSFRFDDRAGHTAKFRIRSEGNVAWLSGLIDSVPVFRERSIAESLDAEQFLKELHTFGSWNKFLNLRNPVSILTDSDVRITVRKAISAFNSDYDPATFEPVKDLTKPVFLHYFGDETPALQIQLENLSEQELWFQPLYLGFDYSVSVSTMKAFSLESGKAANLQYSYQLKLTDILRLRVDPQYRELGYTEITEHLKFIVSTQPIDAGTLSSYAQEGLRRSHMVHIGKTKTIRSLDPGMDEFAKDWMTLLLGLQVSYPAKGAIISEGGRYEASNIKIQLPDGFSTSFAWSSSSQIQRSMNAIAPPELTTGNAALQPLNWIGTRGDASALNVLELFNFSDRNKVSPENPLLIDFGTGAIQDLLALAFDPESGLYYPAGYQRDNGTLAITRLPDGPTTERGLFGSMKIFFYKVVLSKVERSYNYPRLALATLTDDLTVKYETDTKKIRNFLDEKAVKKVLLFTHGIIGDTTDMTRAARLAFTSRGTTIENEVDAIITFDYENLNTPIEDNAKALKERLADIGIKKDDAYDVTIIAHSMGGLVARWMIEKEGGNALVNRLILCGTPNAGTPLADVRDAVEVLLTFAINGVAALKPWLACIKLLGRLGNGLSVTFKQMDIETGIYNALNDQTDPQINYIVIAGDTRLIGLNLGAEMTLIEKLFAKLGHNARYSLLDHMIFRQSNDIAVGTQSICTLPGSTNWVKKPKIVTIACDHLNYFVEPVSLTELGRLF